jgi:hypothetical protein
LVEGGKTFFESNFITALVPICVVLMRRHQTILLSPEKSQVATGSGARAALTHTSKRRALNVVIRPLAVRRLLTQIGSGWHRSPMAFSVLVNQPNSTVSPAAAASRSPAMNCSVLCR